MLRDVSRPIPQPDEIFDNGKLYDPAGHTLHPQKEANWMVRANSKLSEQVTLSKGTLWLLATGFILLQLILNYGGSLVGWARDDQSKVKDIQSIQTGQQKTTEAIERIESKFEKLDERLRAQELQDAKIQGFKAGVAETQSDKGAHK